MIARIVLATLAGVAASAKLVHSKCQSLMGFDAQCTKRHSTCNEMLHYALNRLHLVNGCRCCGLLPTEEVTDKYRTFLLVHLRRPLLELLVTAQTGGKLQVCYCLWIPRMFNAVFAPSKLTLVLQHRLILCCFMQTYGITGNFFQSDTANGTYFCTEVSAQQVLAQTDTLENLRTAIRTDGRNAHLRHNLF